jgi:hypothetical protein
MCVFGLARQIAKGGVAVAATEMATSLLDLKPSY